MCVLPYNSSVLQRMFQYLGWVRHGSSGMLKTLLFCFFNSSLSHLRFLVGFLYSEGQGPQNKFLCSLLPIAMLNMKEYPTNISRKTQASNVCVCLQSSDNPISLSISQVLDVFGGLWLSCFALFVVSSFFLGLTFVNGSFFQPRFHGFERCNRGKIFWPAVALDPLWQCISFILTP